MTALLELRTVSRSFKQGGRDLQVLNQVSLSLEAGELVALVGASGSGKSTLLQIAGLLDKPTEGEVFVAGKAVKTSDDASRTEVRKSQLGFVYQFHHLLPDFTALENVMISGRIQGQKASDAKENAETLMEELGLADRMDHVPSRLSGGEQQRVAIARALMGHPTILLADEPTGNLDDETSVRVFKTMMDAATKRNMAALIVTHDSALATKAHRTLVLDHGTVIEETHRDAAQEKAT